MHVTKTCCRRRSIRYWAFLSGGIQDFKNPLLFQDNVYESSGRADYHGVVFEMTKRFRQALQPEL